MSTNDYISMANNIKAAINNKESFSLPLMKMADFAKVLQHLRQSGPELV